MANNQTQERPSKTGPAERTAEGLTGERAETASGAPEREKSHPRFWRRVAIVFVVLGILRLVAPMAIQALVNGPGMAGGERGSIGNVDLSLWRGAIEVNDVLLKAPPAPESESESGTETEPKSDSETDSKSGSKSGSDSDEGLPPLLVARRVDLNLDWSALLTGRIAAEMILHQPVVDYVALAQNGPEEEAPPEDPDAPEDTGTPAKGGLPEIVPFNFKRFVIRDGEVRFTDRSTDPPVDVYMNDLYVELLDLSNLRDDNGDPRWTELEVAGRPFGTGEFELRLRLNPLAERLTFEMDGAVRAIQVTDLNDALAAYGDIDAEAGTFSLFLEFAAKDGRFDGYVKPIFDDLELARWAEISGPADALDAFWDAMVGLGTELIENQPKDQLAVEIPMEGEFNDPKIGVWAAVGSLLQNALIQALTPAIDSSIEIGDLRGGAWKVGK